jgi:DNA-directed RNA polymerase subunit RPC12/RpoP
MSQCIRCPNCGSELLPGEPDALCPGCLLKAGLESQPRAGSASSRFALSSAEELAARFPQLEILELLGRGGMGAVYKARQRELDRLVAVKILPPEVSLDAAFAERFTREARTLARLNHPHIVAVHDFGRTEDGLYYFVMEYVDGVNLRQIIGSGGMTPGESLAIVPQICDALQYAHDEGIVHRDIKPENILIDRRGRVKIADYGLAKLMDQETPENALTGTEQVMGTLRYMAPEQLERTKAVDHRADIYSLGVVFYELLTGELPLGKFAPPSRKVMVDVRLDDVVLRALEKEPAQRYQHVSEVKTDVESIIRSPQQAGASDAAGSISDDALRQSHSPCLETVGETDMTDRVMVVQCPRCSAQVSAPATAKHVQCDKCHAEITLVAAAKAAALVKVNFAVYCMHHFAQTHGPWAYGVACGILAIPLVSFFKPTLGLRGLWVAIGCVAALSMLCRLGHLVQCFVLYFSNGERQVSSQARSWIAGLAYTLGMLLVPLVPWVGIEYFSPSYGLFAVIMPELRVRQSQWLRLPVAKQEGVTGVEGTKEVASPTSTNDRKIFIQ